MYPVYKSLGVKEECKDVKTLIILLIVILIVYSPVWGGYLLYFIFKLNIFLVVATACAAFWAGPFTPFFPLCIAVTLAIKKLLKRKDRKEKAARNYLQKLSEADYTGKRILVVDDNELNREIAVEILQMTGAEVETAENGKIAVEKVEASPKGLYDLIFMDIQMPVMNGYEATAAIRSLPGEQGKLPIVAMTANAFAEDVQLAKNTGMNGHIAKPLDMNKLNDVLENWL